MATRMVVPAHIEDGICGKQPHMLEEGDLIEWKRDGEKGVRRARVDCIYPELKRPVRIVPTDMTGSLRRRWISKEKIVTVMDAHGVRKQPYVARPPERA